MNGFSKRGYIVIGLFVLTGLVFTIRLFLLQVIDPVYKVFATNNVLREVVQFPARGLIFDRHGNLLVHNKPAYDLLVTPREIEPFDTLYLCQLLEIEKEDLIVRIQAASEYSRYRPSVIIRQISPETYAILQERIFRFKGFHPQSRTLREYNYPVAAHALGYVGEVNSTDLEQDRYYSQGDYIGVSGIEKTYETWLRGSKGVKKFLVDVHNRIQGSYLDGVEDIPARVGHNLTSTIDINLQIYAEKLLQNKKGSVVAIEPSTGEILAIVSAPAYDPGKLVGRVRGVNYAQLANDTLKPLFNRPLMAEYPPGSTFKMLNALIALEEETITTGTQFTCAGTASLPIRCTHSHSTPLQIVEALHESCNPFFWNTFRSIFSKNPTTAEGYNIWRNHLLQFGIGRRLNTDLSIESKGSLPEVSYYDRIYGKGRWSALTIRSMAIGQGELGVTPLQLANYCCALANRGFFYTPHMVRQIENGSIDSRFQIKTQVGIDQKHFDPVIRGMEIRMGTGTSYAIPEINIYGKTGTAENPHGSDHSVFMAFAPKDEPQIAVSVYIENGVWGARYAAPIASLIIEKYLADSISTNRKWLEQRMIEANLLNPFQPK